jgi:hypothetical protein
MADDDKEPMEAGGTGGDGRAAANDEDPASAGRPDMEDNQGQSGGGAYPNPHNDPANADAEGGFMGHGGQSDNRYYGDGEPFADGAAERDNAVTEDQS